MTIVVKNMVCRRCELMVNTILERLEINFDKVTIGEIVFSEALSDDAILELKNKLAEVGLELLDKGRDNLTEKIKQLVIKKARNETNGIDLGKALSHYLSDKLFHEYTYLSSLFSASERRTIESFYISQRIEKGKELLVYGQMNVAEIAFELGYSSPAHFSNQFKKTIGHTPSEYLKNSDQTRVVLDAV